MTDRPHDWHRLSPRMLLVHPVHEMLRQLPWWPPAIRAYRSC